MDSLAQAGHHAIALDLPYFGRAERPKAQSFLAVMDRFVAAAAQQYDAGEGVILVGNSVGGLAALRAAQRSDLPIVSVIAIGPAGLAVPWWMRLLQRARPVVDWALALPIPAVVRGTVAGPAVISTVFSRAVATGRMTDAAKTQYASHWGPGDLRRQLILGGQALTELTDGKAIDNAGFVVPVTLVWGDRDRICPATAGAMVQKAHPEVEVRLIKGSGHCPQYDHPEAVATIIAENIAQNQKPQITE